MNIDRASRRCEALEEPRLTILIAGGAGRMGPAVATRLLEHGHRVLVYDSLVSGTRESVPLGAKFIFGDVRDPQLVSLILKMEKVDVIVHTATKNANAVAREDVFSIYDVNVQGTLNLLRAASRQKVRQFIFSSSGSEMVSSPAESSLEMCKELLKVAAESKGISIASLNPRDQLEDIAELCLKAFNDLV